MYAKTALVLLAALGTASLVGCSNNDNKAAGENVGAGSATLRRMKSCDELATELRADARTKLDVAIDEQIALIKQYGAGGGYGYGGDSPVAMDDAASGGAKSTASPTAESGATSGSSGNSSSQSPARAGDYSTTNTQVQGVDEADFVKTDGKYIYLIHGAELRIVDAFPKEALKEVGKATLEGSPTEMFLDKDRGEIVVYSQVNGTPIYKAAGVTPRDDYQEYYGYFGGGYATTDVGTAPEAAPQEPSSGTAKRAPDADPSGDVATPSTGGGTGGTYEPYRPLTKVTVLKLSGATTTVASEHYFEGNYLSSRRVSQHVRTVLQGGAHGPALKTYIEYGNKVPSTEAEYIALLEQLRVENHKILDASQASDWLPYSFTKSGGAVKGTLAKCEDFYVPTAGTTEAGLTQIASIDLDKPADAPHTASIAGQADTVYSTEGSLYLAGRSWNQNYWRGAVAVPATGGGTARSGSVSSGSAGAEESTPATPPNTTTPPAPAPARAGVKIATSVFGDVATVTMNFTHVHKFDLTTDPSFATYVGSGTVAGQVKDQFSLDEYQGNLRIATTEQREGKSSGTFNHVYVLGPSGTALVKLGETPDLAKGEQIYSVRFLGARGYVVTFRQVDPLFALDLADPKAPKVTGELKIPGFSEYMHPIDDTHLLTIGRDADAGGRQNGLALQLFDVTNPAKPIQQQKFVYDGAEYGSSDAEYDHKAFTYFADRGLLAFPYYAYGNQVCDSKGVCTGGPKSTLEIFSVSATAGFVKLGALDSSAFLNGSQYGYCGGYYGPSVRRGLFLEDTAYAISYGGIIAKKVSELASVGVSIPLAPPVIPVDGYYYGGRGGAPAVDCAIPVASTDSGGDMGL